ncbi:MAG: hypothetical protein JO313_15160 [Verrucomicrobia bacterium]|nr:hypothetical protein [Verrucomicrobiota bacterium]
MPFTKATSTKIIELISLLTVSESFSTQTNSITAVFHNFLEHFRPGASEFFQDLAERLKHLETYRPTAGDFAVEAIQKVFLALMHFKYRWGKNGEPTKGEVIEMAKAVLAKSGRKVRQSGWTGLLRDAGLGWLKAGAAGRPSKAELDENAKAEREYKSLWAKAVRDFYGGDIIRARDLLKAAFGSKQEYQRSERARLALSSESGPEDEA